MGSNGRKPEEGRVHCRRAAAADHDGNDDRKEDGRPLVLDGPFAETKEQLAGYYILDCENLDEAIAWAAKIPTACKGEEGCIEIRPIAAIPPR